MSQVKIPFTKEGMLKIKRDYENLVQSRPEAVAHLKKARELGDLKENGYYKASRAKLSDIDRRLHISKWLLAKAYVINTHSKEQINIGNKITLKNNDALITYTLVSKYEADPAAGKIKYQVVNITL